MTQNNHEKLARIINDIQFTMMTTVDSMGKMHSRPMVTMSLTNPGSFDGTLWFFTKEDTVKTNDIKSGREVLLTYAHPGSQKYISISGIASIEKNKSKMKELWNSSMETWFPEGLSDPELALIKVDVEAADLWDSPPGKVIRLIEKAKSFITGRPYSEPSVNGQHLDIKIH